MSETASAGSKSSQSGGSRRDHKDSGAEFVGYRVKGKWRRRGWRKSGGEEGGEGEATVSRI